MVPLETTYCFTFPRRDFHNFIAVIIENDRISKTCLVAFIKFRRSGNIQSFFRKEIQESALQNFLPGDFLPFQPLPVNFIDLRVTFQHFIRAHSKSKLLKQCPDCRFFCCLKIQQCAIHIPQNRCYHNLSVYPSTSYPAPERISRAF